MEKINKPFEVISEYMPSGDQPEAIAELAMRINAGETDVVLLGATGTGKSATTAWLIEQIQRPTLILEPNKTLAAQMCQEFRDLLPNNAIEYFVSYYDYYQPEAYIPQSDTYIDKDSSINSDVERLRHSATASLMTRRDVVVVSSVSCIYGLGTPEEYLSQMVPLFVGQTISRDVLIRHFIKMQYSRNDIDFSRGTFRVRGDTIEIIPMYEKDAIRIEMFGDEVEKLSVLNAVTGNTIESKESVTIFPASHYVASDENLVRAMKSIRAELDERVKWFKGKGKLVEAQRIEQRTTFDLEMLAELGMCKGIENYSRHIDGREAGSAPNTLIDFFDDDFLLVIDESHVTVPQIGAMFEGDASRKRSLIDYGFRLPSAADNRPLKWSEFLERIGQTVYLSATPGDYEMKQQAGPDGKGKPVEQIIRPTGLIDPTVEIRPTVGQIENLLGEIEKRTAKDERVLVTTLTKRMAEDLTTYLQEKGVKVEYLHSDVDTLRRVELLRELRLGTFDVLVGINLLREGLDLPEVSLVAIIDADKEGFLRSYRSLIQTIGRAARNVSGAVIMYADNITDSMKAAIKETDRRREKQLKYNKDHGIDPQPLRKKISDVTDSLREEADDTEALFAQSNSTRKGNKKGGAARKAFVKSMSDVASSASERFGSQSGSNTSSNSTRCAPVEELEQLVLELTEQMLSAAENLNFELAARLRDEVHDLKRELRQMRAALA